MTGQRKFKWGISTLGCHELDLEQVCTLAAHHDIHTLEIRALADRQDLPRYLDESYANAGEIQAVLDAHQQHVIALNSGFTLIRAQEADRQEMLGFARWAEALDIPYVRVFGGGSMTEPLTTQALDHAAKNLEWWHQTCKTNGWKTRLALETHTGFSSAARCLKLQEHAGIPLDIIWDTHHTWKLGNETAEETWNQMAPLIRYVQIKDSIPVPSAKHPYSYVLPGTGEFPAKELLSLLASHDYAGIVSLEWERKWHPYMPPLDEALDALVTAGLATGCARCRLSVQSSIYTRRPGAHVLISVCSISNSTAEVLYRMVEHGEI